MRGAADERVGVGGQRVLDVVTGQGHAAAGAGHDRAQDVLHHLAVGGAWGKKGRKGMGSS